MDDLLFNPSIDRRRQQVGQARRARCVCIIWIIHFSVPGKERPSDTAEVALPLTQIIIARSALFRVARSVLLNERTGSLFYFFPP